MAILIWISRTFLVSDYLSICNFPYFLTNKQKTKKGREIQITQILVVSIIISYIFCALGTFLIVFDLPYAPLELFFWHFVL